MRLLYSRHLEHFLAVCEAGSLRKAAQASNITQPALTKSVRLLENALSVSLFERSAGGVVPTQAAAVLRRHALQIVNSARYVEMEIAALRGGQQGALRIGCGMVWSVTSMPAVLASLHKRFPRLEVSLQTGVADQLMPRLLEGDLDVVVAAGAGAALPAGFQTIALQQTAMLAFCRQGHALARRRRVPLRELGDCEFAGFSDDADAQHRLDTLFQQHGLRAPRVMLRSTSLATLLATAAVSDSLTILSDLLAPQAEAHGLRRLRLAESLWSLSMGISFRTQIAEMAPLQALLELCRGAAYSSTSARRGGV